MFKISKYIILDIVRSKVLIAYTLLLAIICTLLFLSDSDVTKDLVSITTIVMIIVPLVSIIYATTYYFNAAELTELLVSQPINRRNILLGEYIGISSSILSAFLLGVGIPVTLFAFSATGVMLMLAGSLVTISFTSLAFWASTKTRDKSRGIGLALMIWFYAAIIYDALVLLFLFSFSDYPLEKAMIMLTALNPVDLARIMILLKLDISALMGYTGALYRDFFGSGLGIFFSVTMLAVWSVIPVLSSMRTFAKKDL